ncbi:MAG: hypothetical protein HUU50_17670 [Candidatus Brocadiae bacterium]|nr:hypothetical protein [Candidatus Brocadiia bacterium]
MNFFLYQNAVAILEKASRAVDFMNYIASGKWNKKRFESLLVAGISDQDYIGYRIKPKLLPFDLLFTRTARKEIQPYLGSALVKAFLDMAHNEFRRGERLRRQGDMQSIIIPGTQEKNVLLFVPMMMEKRGVQLIVGVDDADNWNKHGKAMDKKNDYKQKAESRKRYYKAICEKCLGYLKKIKIL